MNIVSTIRRMLRGEVSFGTAALEAIRRVNSGLERRRERRDLAPLNRRPAKLAEEFASMTPSDLLAHFRSRKAPQFFPGCMDRERSAALQRELGHVETERLIAEARRIANDHCWPLLGFGEKCFGTGEIDWNLDPLSGLDWPLNYYADIELMRNDGSDARVLWELNRLGHLLTLGRAYAVTNDEEFSAEFLRQVASWRMQNPVARGANWNCAMEVALRAMNLLAAFTLFLPSPKMTEDSLSELLMIFDQHGAHIRRNLEYSHIATSNHYLCDVAGLLWLGLMLPELEQARAWREFGMRELLNEMDKQVLPDGADYEASTGYHRLKTELFLYSFVLCHVNGNNVDQKYWQKLHAMLEYIRGYLRPCGRAPLIGDSDSGQVFPLVRRSGDDHAYLLTLAAAVFQEPAFKSDSETSEELFWILGEQGLRDYEALSFSGPAQSQAFPEAGTYLLRENDLYLHFNASDSGVRGRGSHGHNDALSIEVSALGTSFIVDPGSFVYTADLHQRHMFRSTAYHSTVGIDGVEQNTIAGEAPFVIGDEAHPIVIKWESGHEKDVIVAEHSGYQRLPEPVTHRRSVTFYKSDRFWLIEDEFSGTGRHYFDVRFHFDSGLDVVAHGDAATLARDSNKGTRLWVQSLDLKEVPQLEQQFTSRDYGARKPSLTARWSIESATPHRLRWLLVPIGPKDDERERFRLSEQCLADARIR